MPTHTIARRVRAVGLCLLPVPVMLLASACSLPSDSAESESAGLVVRDSAGVEIVEHSAAYIAALPVWTIDTAPAVRIPGDTPEQPFTDVVHAGRRPDGRFVLFDVRLRDLREFSATGEFLRILAPQGRGPGEVAYVGRLSELSNDTVTYVDVNQRRISFVAGDGTPGPQYNFPRFSDGAQARVVTYMADGRVLAGMRGAYKEYEQAGGPVFRDSFAVVLLDGERQTASDSVAPRVDTIAVVPDYDAYIDFTSDVDGERLEEQVVRLGRRTRIGTNGTRVVIGTNLDHEFMEYGPSGPLRLVRNGTAARPISDEDKQAFRDAVVADYEGSTLPPDVVAILMVNVNRWRIADAHEFYRALVFGTDGTLWAEAPRTLPDEAYRYVVYDTLGRAIARAEFPAGVSPREFSSTEMLGVLRDADEIPHVMLWPLVIKR